DGGALRRSAQPEGPAALAPPCQRRRRRCLRRGGAGRAGGAEAGSTAIGSAVLDALELFKGSGFDSPRQTIDIVSNGFSNAGIDPTLARDAAEAAHVTVNALVILDEYDWLEGYYRQQVIGGIGAFVRTAEGRDTFIQALIAKLVDEIV
ncbi:DUF1194 domain-containing protein, partial [Inquilinus limosus]|uniref:DUF1194 domain-containing protein n=1 Tax=Inquilinus limosus TaxID=171674 RepID=UPI001269AC60